MPALHLAFAVPDHPWVDSAEGAAVRIAMTVGSLEPLPGRLCLVTEERETGEDAAQVVLTETVAPIHADLTTGADVTGVQALKASAGLSCPGVKLHGAGFIVTKEDASGLVADLAACPVIKPYRNGKDLMDRPRGVFVIDLFGLDVPVDDMGLPPGDAFPSLSLFLPAGPGGERRADARPGGRSAGKAHPGGGAVSYAHSPFLAIL